MLFLSLFITLKPQFLIFNLNNFGDHGLQKFLLLDEELPSLSNIKRTPGIFSLAFLLKFGPDALFKDLKSILSILSIYLRNVADTTDTSENTLILDEGGLWTPRSDKCDAFSTSGSFQGLMLDIPSLENGSSTLQFSLELIPKVRLHEHTVAGPRTLSTSPAGVRTAVSPPTMPVQSESIMTQTKGKLS